MDELIIHRKARISRAVLAGLFLLQGIFAPWSGREIYAADGIQIGVIPSSPQPPAAIADLLASPSLTTEGQISLTWTAPLGNAGNVPIPNWPVAAYQIHYATFSIASFAGDSNAWWNASYSGAAMLSSPSYIPKSPGQLESYSFGGLSPGTHYYFAIKSISGSGITSAIDLKASGAGQQANAIAPQFATNQGTPQMPTGLQALVSGAEFTLQWSPVTKDTSGNPIVIDHYRVDRYLIIGSTPTLTANISPPQVVFNDSPNGQLYYYRVTAVSVGSQVSAPSDYIDSSSDSNRIMVAPDDLTTRLVIPGSLAQELNSGFNIYKQDLELRLARRPQDEFDTTLRSYEIQAFIVDSGQVLPNFSFSQPGMSVQLGLGAVIGSGKLNASQVAQLARAPTNNAGSIAQIIAVYWFNGSGYVRIGDPVLTGAQSIAVAVRNIGIYQIRVAQIGTTFKMTQGSPYPRVITPNDPSQNNRVFFFFENPTDSIVSGSIYDIRGAKVRDIAVNAQSPSSNALVWDGRDSQGSVVPSGVYLYKIMAGKESATGTVVVAR